MLVASNNSLRYGLNQMMPWLLCYLSLCCALLLLFENCDEKELTSTVLRQSFLKRYPAVLFIRVVSFQLSGKFETDNKHVGESHFSPFAIYNQ